MLFIRQSIADDMIAHARKEAPNEACGYLAQKDGIVVRYYPMKNADESPEHFSFDPAEQFSVVRSIRDSGLKVAAVFHSHPATPARMSQEDIRLARDPSVGYVIASLADVKPVVAAFRMRNGTVAKEEIEIREETDAGNSRGCRPDGY